jgi:hypothetical protein
MIYLLCRNRVADFSRWKAVFASRQAAHQAAGPRLIHIWRKVEEPNNIFFLFEERTSKRPATSSETPRLLRQPKPQA